MPRSEPGCACSRKRVVPSLSAVTAAIRAIIGTSAGSAAAPPSLPARVTVSVNDHTALLTHAQWAYTNGGSLSFDQTYSNVGTYRLASTANIAARFPGYSVDGTITFSNYKQNPPVSPTVF